MTSHDTRPHPLDFDKLSKGSVISPAEVEAAIGVQRLHPDYALKTLTLAQRIEDEMSDRGEPATVVVRKFAIIVLSDEEASVHNENSFERSVRRLLRTHRRMMSVDAGQLSEARKTDHDTQLGIQARQILALKKARKGIFLPSTDERPSLAKGD